MNGYRWSSSEVKEIISFPVTCFIKENGFLGLVSYDFNNNELFICSKSTNQGEYADLVRKEIDRLDKDFIKEYVKDNNCTLIFEVIQPWDDPHIVEYDRNEVVLLDIVKNTFETEYMSYEEVERISSLLNIRCKKADCVFEDWDSLYSWRQQVKNDMSIKHEGWVIRDKNNFQVKYKSKYYSFWKEMRKVKNQIEGNKKVNKRFETIEEVEVYKLMNSIDKEDLKNLTIIQVANKYYKEKNSESFWKNCEKASEIVSEWPDWKRNAFGPFIANHAPRVDE